MRKSAICIADATCRDSQRMLERTRLERLFRLDDSGWARHANPWSVWTRNTVLPLLVLAFWSRSWIGWWALAPITIAILWAWANPRLFGPPKSIDNWASKAVLGERIWLNRKIIAIPEHHRVVPLVLIAVASTGTAATIYGVVALEVWPTLVGMALIYSGKLWFLDRMVWLYQDRALAPETQTNRATQPNR